MAMYVFSTAGEAVGFVFESIIYDREGMPRGRIFGSRVHRMDGTYAGEWFHQMVVERRTVAPRAISPIAPPEPRAVPRDMPRRHVVTEYGRYPDLFDSLCEPEPFAIAAE